MDEGDVGCSTSGSPDEVKRSYLEGLQIQGYELLGLERVVSTPTEAASQSTSRCDSQAVVSSIPTYSNQQARELLLEHVNKFLCYSAQAARDMIFTSITTLNAYQYSLESYMEKREIAWTWEPHTGGKVDGPASGNAPLPWEVRVEPPDQWETQTRRICVPHTEHIRTCHSCTGNRWNRCQRCMGRGGVHCAKCDGKGDVPSRFPLDPSGGSKQACCTCAGSGGLQCRQCHGKGRLACSECSANGQINCFVELAVTWTNHLKRYVYKPEGFPSDIVSEEQEAGLILEDFAGKLGPIQDFPNEAIKQISSEYLKEHDEAFPTEVLIRQRQQVRVVPVTEVRYEWKNQQGSFFIYGFESKIKFPRYPQETICGCTLL